MSHLVPCPSCARHVRVGDGQCPFCASSLASIADAPEPKLPASRLGRAAQFAFGAAVATSMTVSACGDGEPAPTDGGGQSSSDSGTVGGDAGFEEDVDSGGLVPLYGAVPPDSGTAGDAGPDDDVDSGGVVPLYGAVPPDSGLSKADSGFEASDSGAVIALYGAVPLDAAVERNDAGNDSGLTIAPAYGAPAFGPESSES